MEAAQPAEVIFGLGALGVLISMVVWGVYFIATEFFNVNEEGDLSQLLIKTVSFFVMTSIGLVGLAFVVGLGTIITKFQEKNIQDGVDAYKVEEYESAFEIFEPFAEKGNVLAQSYLGLMYEQGEGVPQDYVEAVKWYLRAAMQEDAWAQFNLGVMYYNGNGVPQDWSEAAKWFRIAAKQGNAVAQFNLALMYDYGRGVPKDDAEAVKWYRLAAEQGVAEAQHNLGVMYKNGEGVPQNFTNAYILFDLAAAQGNEDAWENREIVAEKLTPDQLAEAQRLSSEWKVGGPLPLQED